MAIKNMAASVLMRFKNQSKEDGIPFQISKRRNCNERNIKGT